jgi:hypothetical protein
LVILVLRLLEGREIGLYVEAFIGVVLIQLEPMKGWMVFLCRI